MKIKLKYLPLLLLIIVASCSKDEVVEPTAEQTFGIRHDKSLSDYENIASGGNPNLPDFSTVVFFNYSLDGSNNRDYVASGVVIDEEWILTAGHNFYDLSEQSTPAPKSGILVKLGNNPNLSTSTYSVSEIVFHPTWLAGNQELNHANDLCLIKVSNVISGVTPAVIFNQSNESLNSVVWHCGFGDYSKLSGQNPDLFSKKHAMSNILDRIKDGFQTSHAGITYNGGLLAFDFDNPSGSINSLGDAIVNEDEGLLGNGTSTAMALDFEGTTVSGDSGGPLFIFDNGVWKVAGILSGGADEPIPNHVDGNYGDISIYTRVSTSYSWIQSVIQ